MISLIHPGCNANVRAVATALEQAGKLEELFTSISGWKGFHFFREYKGIPQGKIRTKASREWGRLLAPRIGFRFLTKHETGVCSVDAVWEEVDRWASENISCGSRMVYAYEDAAIHSFQKAKKVGLKRIYDLPIGYWKAAREIYREEIELFPEFSPLIQGLRDSPAKQAKKDRELELADHVHACSGFVKSTLVAHGYSEAKITVTQFGSPSIQGHCKKKDPESVSKRPMKVLFVGKIDQRKGIGYLLKAMEHFSPEEVEFHLIGAKPPSMDVLAPYWGRVHDHGTMNQKKVWETMRDCDLFLFPSLFEGQALVVLEAMACGLPVVVTPHAGVDRVVREGKEGFMIPIRSVESIVEKIAWAKNNPEERCLMGESALNRSLEFTWEKYQSEILQSTLAQMS